VIAQSSGGYLATELAARKVETIAAIATVEMTAFPNLGPAELQALAGVPLLILWGDRIAGSQSGSRRALPPAATRKPSIDTGAMSRIWTFQTSVISEVRTR